MNSTNIQQLLKIDPIRPPSKSDNHRRSKSTLSQKTLVRVPSLQSQQDTGSYPISTSASTKFLQCNIIQTTEDYDPGEDERISITLPQSHLNFNSPQDNKTLYDYTKNLVAHILSPKSLNKKKTNFPKRFQKERRPLMESLSNMSTPAPKSFERTTTGLKVQDQSNISTESHDKENTVSMKPQYVKPKQQKGQNMVKSL